MASPCRPPLNLPNPAGGGARVLFRELPAYAPDIGECRRPVPYTKPLFSWGCARPACRKNDRRCRFAVIPAIATGGFAHKWSISFEVVYQRGETSSSPLQRSWDGLPTALLTCCRCLQRFAIRSHHQPECATGLLPIREPPL